MGLEVSLGYRSCPPAVVNRAEEAGFGASWFGRARAGGC